jgi:DNA-binding IclR family transcriptional regulator
MTTLEALAKLKASVAELEATIGQPESPGSAAQVERLARALEEARKRGLELQRENEQLKAMLVGRGK